MPLHQTQPKPKIAGTIVVMEGFLYIDKPEGWTSFDVVNYVRKMVANIEGKKPRNVKVGHTGTLDPAATGLLMLCVGKNFTKKVPELIKQDKTYLVEMTLRKTSTTGDKEGVIKDWGLGTEDYRRPQQEELQDVLNSFIGEIEQIPPIYSAIRIDGKRAYELAREGKDVVMKPRKATIYSITDIAYAYPIVTFETRVGSGTYIRSLTSDIGKKLGTGAYMSNLRRTSIGEIDINQTLAISDLTPEILQKTLATSS
jgi:tRNA pseudouridine55 synthase